MFYDLSSLDRYKAVIQINGVKVILKIKSLTKIIKCTLLDIKTKLKIRNVELYKLTTILFDGFQKKFILTID